MNDGHIVDAVGPPFGNARDSRSVTPRPSNMEE
jgi:hypothetical protein